MGSGETPGFKRQWTVLNVLIVLGDEPGDLGAHHIPPGDAGDVALFDLGVEEAAYVPSGADVPAFGLVVVEDVGHL